MGTSGYFRTPAKAPFTSGRAGGGNRDRTGDLLHAMQALSQLSYTPNRRAEIIADQFLQGPSRLPVTLVFSSNFRPCTSPRMLVSPSIVLRLMRATPLPRMLAFGHSISHV